MEPVISLALVVAYLLISKYLEILKIRAQKDDAPWECEDCNGCGACCTCEEEETETFENRLARQDINYETKPSESRLPGLDNNANV